MRRQGPGIDDHRHEVSMMFMKHCPDQSLASVFKYKSAEKWSACDIQERLDEHMQEKKSQTVTTGQLKQNTVERQVLSQSQVPMVDNAPVLNSTVSSTPSSLPPAVASADTDCMKSLVSLLDRLVTQQTQVPANLSSRAAVSHSFQKVCRLLIILRCPTAGGRTGVQSACHLVTGKRLSSAN